jgi:hypothetical protein
VLGVAERLSEAVGARDKKNLQSGRRRSYKVAWWTRADPVHLTRDLVTYKAVVAARKDRHIEEGANGQVQVTSLCLQRTSVARCRSGRLSSNAAESAENQEGVRE